MARHSSTSSNECIEHGAGNGPTFESELEEYEEPIIKEANEKLPKGSMSGAKENASGFTDETENDRKRYSTSIHKNGKFKASFISLRFINEEDLEFSARNNDFNLYVD